MQPPTPSPNRKRGKKRDRGLGLGTEAGEATDRTALLLLVPKTPSGWGVGEGSILSPLWVALSFNLMSLHTGKSE